ncbi:hypothetical protein LAY57_18000 [Argonema antarcticum A004/B2]|uniref:hypothetical protein n=1 Tax=Argonema antarcticum TaxID=2942763 RepID=UPI002010D1C4|nr:hypothetical protein [Argonema antarcticum]MCL1472561.1 hypothetical protein [Argonema antarcticum A004/B2]
MLRKLAITLCLLTGTTWTGGFLLPVFAADPVPSSATQQQTPANSALMLEDLPPGFRELPADVAAEVSTKFEALREQLTQAGMKPNKFFAYINPQNFQIVFGFTGELSEQPDRANFDATLKQIQEPEYQQQLMSQYREALKASQGIEILEYGSMPELNNVADTSSGMTVSVSMQGQPLRLDVAAFRRSNVGAFTGIMYPKGRVPTVQLGYVARKLDNRILRASSGVNPTGATNPSVNPAGVTAPDVNSSDTTNPGVNSTGAEDSGVDRPGAAEVK